MKFRLILFLILLISVSSCKPKYDDSEIPSYIQIQDYQLETAIGNEKSSKFTDFWLSVSNSFIGTFEMNSTVPVLRSGKNKIIVYPGVKENGIASTRAIYPFYKPYIVDSNLTIKQPLKLRPNFIIKTETKFPLNETFENPIPLIQLNDSGSVRFKIKSGNGDNNYSSGSYLEVNLDSGNKYLRLRSTNFFSGLSYTKPTWIEISFHSDVVIHTQIQAVKDLTFTTSPFVDLNSTNGKWNKVYLNLTEITNGLGQGYVYRLIFTADWDGNHSLNTLQMDNIKLLTIE